jgi:hypothetical protein
MQNEPNNWVQATPGYICVFVLAQAPRASDAQRSAAAGA